MQIIVLGMHRSGTSATARLINMMGAYFGPEGCSLGLSKDNPKGYWERRDIMQINDALLALMDCQWNNLAHWNPNQQNNIPALLAKKMRQLILDLDAHRPWMAKDPRFCLTLPAWLPLLEVPLTVLIYRDPREIAQSLHQRDNLPADYALALWEHYAVNMLNNTRDLPRSFVSHNDLMKKPVKTAEALLLTLKSQGIRRMVMPSVREIRAFIDPKLYRANTPPDIPLSSAQQTLMEMLQGTTPQETLLTISTASQILLQNVPTT